MGKSGPLVSLVAELAAYGQQSLTELVRGSGLTFQGTIKAIWKVTHTRNVAAPAEKTVISFWVLAIISPTTRIPWSHRGRARHSIAAVRYSPEGDSKISRLELACLEQGRSVFSREPVEC
jgi:hypothetical protein